MRGTQLLVAWSAFAVAAVPAVWGQADNVARRPPQPQPVPVIPQPPQPATTALRWEAARGGAIPSGAQPTGYEPGGLLYTCRAAVEGGMHPGKVRPGFDGCFVPVGGRETSVPAYEVLLGPANVWEVARDGQIPQGAAEAGRTRAGQPLYACRAAAANRDAAALMPGKIGAGLRGCNVGVGGEERTMPMYEVLLLR